MALAPQIMLAAPELHDRDFRALAVAYDGREHLAPVEPGLTELHLGALPDEEHLAELDRGARLGIELLDTKDRILRHSILLAAGGNDRVHDDVKPLNVGAGAPARKAAHSTHGAGKGQTGDRPANARDSPGRARTYGWTYNAPTSERGGLRRASARTMRNPKDLPTAMTLEDIRELVRNDMAAVDDVIRARLKSSVPLIDRVAEHIVSGGGKRLRPLLVVLVGRACGNTGHVHVEAAAFIEFIHTATLLHDDVVDSSSMRRGRDTANEVFGNQASVLVGDFVYSRAFQMMASLDSQRVIEIMADATNVIAEGEVLQLMNAHDPETTEQRYLDVIYRKTARLFEAGAEVAAVLSSSGRDAQRSLSRYGRHLGTAYQLVDDVLDFRSNPAERGKNLGDDLAEGKPTLPLIHALKLSSESERELIRQAIRRGGLAQLQPIIGAIESSGGLDYAARLARREAEAALDALDVLPNTDYKRGLQALARFAVEHTT